MTKITVVFVAVVFLAGCFTEEERKQQEAEHRVAIEKRDHALCVIESIADTPLERTVRGTPEYAKCREDLVGERAAQEMMGR